MSNSLKQAILRFPFLAVAFCWFAIFLYAQENLPSSETSEPKDFVDLFNKTNLKGWTTKGNWKPQKDGSLMIQPRQGETGWQRYDDYLWTERKYKDFELKVEFAYPTNGNSGIYFRVADRNNPVHSGIESQVFDSSKHKGATSDHTLGGIIPAGIAPTKNMALPPGRWNRMFIRCVGNHLQVRVNGEMVVDVQLNKTTLKDRKSEGYIGLQDHGIPHTVRFRNIQIKEIAPVAPDAAQVFYESKVKPIFEAKCLDCHGEDQQDAQLRLDSLTRVMRGGDSGEPVLIVGAPGDSNLIRLVSSQDEEHRMPLDADPLSKAEIQVLRDWIGIERGWEKSIAAAAVIESDHWSFQKVTRPAVPDTGHQNPIDNFIAKALTAKKLRMSPEANTRRLVRRLFLLMHGVPPTTNQIDDFLASEENNKWSSLVDAVLHNPRYGERFAVSWLDLIRFSETDGFEMNTERGSAWRFRDWVINAFNDDMPYDKFVTSQLAGDVIGELLGTGFLVAGPHNKVVEADEKGQAENVQNEVSDMLNATGTTFLGLTLGCARCHNHKFDPISQKDFYSIQAVFSGVNHGVGSIRQNETNEMELQEIGNRLKTVRRFLSKYAARPSESGEPLRFTTNIESFPAQDARFVRMTINKTKSGAQACIDELEVFSGSKNVGLTSAGAKATSGGDFVHPLHKLSHINDGKYGNSYSWISRDVKGWVQIELAEVTSIDRIVWGRDRTKKIADRLATDYRMEISTDGNRWTTVGDSRNRRQAGTKIVYQFNLLPKKERVVAQKHHATLQTLLSRKNELEKSPVAYIGTFSAPVPTFRLYRGDPLEKREKMKPDTIAVIGQLELNNTASGPERRLAFAKWVTRPDNPLTARVMVNRIWQFHFGEGLVSTSNDFGANGARPSHPKLLDWLAVELMENDWSIKHIHRLIINSKTWRQDSRPRRAALELDSSSQFLWRFPPRRLEAEAIRDSILATSGKLTNEHGGPGFSGFEIQFENVRHYFPKKKYTKQDWRRMVYMTRVRKEVESVFGVFDCPDGNQVTPKRTRSTTPLQALNLLNSTFVLQQAEFLAKRLKSESGDSHEQLINRSYVLCFGRSPSPKERELADQMLKQLGLIQYCRVLLNSNEFVFIL